MVMVSKLRKFYFFRWGLFWGSCHCPNLFTFENHEILFKIVYELNDKKGVTRVPRLQNLVQEERQTERRTNPEKNKSNHGHIE